MNLLGSTGEEGKIYLVPEREHDGPRFAPAWHLAWGRPLALQLAIARKETTERRLLCSM